MGVSRFRRNKKKVLFSFPPNLFLAILLWWNSRTSSLLFYNSAIYMYVGIRDKPFNIEVYNHSSLNEINSVVDSPDTLTSNGDEFLLMIDKYNYIFLWNKFNFSTRISHTIFVDRMFEYCPTILFTIHGYKDNFYVPLVVYFLKNKNSETYTQAIKNI